MTANNTSTPAPTNNANKPGRKARAPKAPAPVAPTEPATPPDPNAEKLAAMAALFSSSARNHRDVAGSLLSGACAIDGEEAARLADRIFSGGKAASKDYLSGFAKPRK